MSDLSRTSLSMGFFGMSRVLCSLAACGGGTNNRSIQFDWITFCFSVWFFRVCKKKTVDNHDGDSSIGERRRDWELHWVLAHICARGPGWKRPKKNKRREKITEEVVEYCGYVLREISIVRQRRQRRRVLFKLQWISKEIFFSLFRETIGSRLKEFDFESLGALYLMSALLIIPDIRKTLERRDQARPRELWRAIKSLFFSYISWKKKKWRLKEQISGFLCAWELESNNETWDSLLLDAGSSD